MVGVQALFRTAVIAVPFIGQRNVSSRETVVKLLRCQSTADDSSSWTELPTREVTFDDVKVSLHVGTFVSYTCLQVYWRSMETRCEVQEKQSRKWP